MKQIEWINSNLKRNYQAVLFDFDGTISLIREGWQPIMYSRFYDGASFGKGSHTDFLVLAHQEGRKITDFTTSVFDMQPIQSRDYHSEPRKDQPEYYHRFWKTILVRTVRDGGTSYYIEGDHRDTVSSLWQKLVK